MTGSSHQRRIAKRASNRAMSQGKYPWLESSIPDPEPRGEAEGVLVDIAYLERSILNDPLLTRSKDPMWIQAFKEHGAYGKPSGCRPCYAKVLQWYKAGKPLPPSPWPGKYHRPYSPTEPPKWEFVEPPKKRRTLWNWLRKLVGR